MKSESPIPPVTPRGDGKDLLGVAEKKSHEAERENGMAEGCAEVLPEGSGGTGVIRGEEEGEHEDEAANAGGTNEQAENQADADGELTIGYEESDWSGVRQNEAAENRGHEGIGTAIVKEAVDPELKAAVEGELGAEDFIFAEDEEDKSDADAEEGESLRVADGRIRIWSDDACP